MPLSMSKLGSQVIVRGFSKQMTEQSKLYAMGIIKGTVLKIISAELYGPMVIELYGCKLALGYEIVSNVIVETISS